MSWTNNLEQFAQIIKNGGVVIFPTDTVWGLGCSVERVDAIKKLYTIKQREPNKPTAILIGSSEQAEKYGVFNEQALSLTKVHWPGALTVVVQATKAVPLEIQGEQKTVGIRHPNFKFVEELTQLVGAGIVAGSANFSGGASPFKKEELDPELIKLIDAVYDGECGGQLPSTVVDCTVTPLKVMREGAIKL